VKPFCVQIIYIYFQVQVAEEYRLVPDTFSLVIIVVVLTLVVAGLIVEYNSE